MNFWFHPFLCLYIQLFYQFISIFFVLFVQVVVQIVLELRYGREDEELMGLQFSNEMVISSKVLFMGNTEDIVDGNVGDTKRDDIDETVIAVADKQDCVLKPFEIGQIRQSYTEL